ncbi:MAG: nitroreductase family protein [Lacibacter sp.]|nr:nitroreductase family protein [Lacibacter sp.]
MTSRQINGFPFESYTKAFLSHEEMLVKANAFYEWMTQRRTCRDFSLTAIPNEVIEKLLLTASTAPSGAHKQPWTFCVVSNPDLKKQIREAAETEEKESYDGRMSEEWIKDLAPLQTNWEKPFLETAPCLIIVFSRSYEVEANGHKHQNYYVKESVGIACGFLLAAIHEAGLVALTHTPSPMNFLSKLLNRPENERPYLLIPVGYAADECWVPVLKRKELNEIAVWY